MKIKNSPLKVALVHDYLKEIGGAEKVFEELTDLFPNAPIYTTLYRPSFFGPHRERLEKKLAGRVHQSFFGHLPFAHKIISPFRFFSPLAFKLFNFRTFDLIITSATGAFFPNSLNKQSAKLICYCHTPPRYLYGLPTGRDVKKYKVINFVLQFIFHIFRLLDFKYSQNVDQYIANSATTASRIKKFYRRDSVVINPPVEIEKNAKFGILNTQRTRACEPEGSEYCKIPNEQGYYLTGGRFTYAKRFDIAIQACNKLKLPLKIFGRDFSGVEAQLRSIAGPTIEFVGEVNDAQKFELYAGAKAFLFTSDQEDFGIMPVEAMSQGCPVVAYGVGGATETVIDGKTGVLFKGLTTDSCAQAITRLQKLKIDPQICISQAQNFSRQKFISKIKKLTGKYA
ncbi:MAG: glycosyltransferase [Candidatus Shapirobacteria bacterium]